MVQSRPVIADIPDVNVAEGAAYTGPVPTFLQGTLPVTWSLLKGPAGMTIDSATGVVYWPCAVAAADSYTVTIQATNAEGSGYKTWHITVPPSYTGWVMADVNLAPAGTPVTFGGQATWLSNGQPSPDANLTIRVLVQGTRRTISLTSLPQTAPLSADGKYCP